MCGNSKTGIIRFHAERSNSMSSEKEYKFLINKEMFDRIGEKFFWNNVFSQINFYYVDKNKKVINPKQEQNKTNTAIPKLHITVLILFFFIPLIIL